MLARLQAKGKSHLQGRPPAVDVAIAEAVEGAGRASLGRERLPEELHLVCGICDRSQEVSSPVHASSVIDNFLKQQGQNFTGSISECSWETCLRYHVSCTWPFTGELRAPVRFRRHATGAPPDNQADSIWLPGAAHLAHDGAPVAHAVHQQPGSDLVWVCHSCRGCSRWPAAAAGSGAAALPCHPAGSIAGSAAIGCAIAVCAVLCRGCWWMPRDPASTLL